MNELLKLAEDPRVVARNRTRPNGEGSCVVYWMQRAQRGHDNPALDVAVRAANALGKPVVVFFAPVPFYPGANLRHYRFLAEGVADIAEDLRQRGVGLIFRPYPQHNLLRFCQEVKPALVVTDEDPLREPEGWRKGASRRLRVPLWSVDADVIVPTRLLQREHYGARTIRPQIHKRLEDFLAPCANPTARVRWRRPCGLETADPHRDFLEDWRLDGCVGPVAGFRGGSREGMRRLRHFLQRGLAGYSSHRNRPESEGTSQLSPYLHFGHLGPHTIALAVIKAEAPKEDKEALLEQLLVRRELAVNFVRFNLDYDSIQSGEAWAHRTLGDHIGDLRPVQYSEDRLENADTHDELWNAAQRQMALSGWMHNRLRMYWAKKILEWSPTPAVAYQRAVRLNDRYQLDGRDPNGYANIAWAIVGKHDRPWPERPIFGKIRYMSQASTARKFNSRAYIEKVKALERGA